MLFYILILYIISLICSKTVKGGTIEGITCSLKSGNTGTCKKLKHCSEVLTDVAESKIPVICGFIGHDAIVCCPTSSATTSTQISTSHEKNSTEIMKQMFSTTPFTSVPTKPSTENAQLIEQIMVSNVTKLSKSLEMCKKYAESAYIEYIVPPQLIGEKPILRKKLNCVVSSTLIVGGILALPKEFPHMAHIGYGMNNVTADWICGGSLISEKYVLTAAHCTETSLGIAKWVRLGDLNIETESDDAKPETFQVITRIRHDGYRRPALYNDIALLELDRNVKFNSYIRPLCLNTDSSLKFDKSVATGWGRIENDGLRSPDLIQVSLTTQPIESCNMSFYGNIGPQLPIGIDPKSMICAGEELGGKDTCQGDSGGPLVITNHLPCMYTQVGLTSFGRKCGAPNLPAVYTKVSNYIDWIENIVWP